MTRRLRKSLILAMLMLLILQAAAAAVAGGEEGTAPRAASYLLSITSANATQRVDPSAGGKGATYAFQIRNNGDSDTPLPDLALTPWNLSANWSYNFIPSLPFQAGPGETKTVLLVIFPAANATAKRYTFNLACLKNATSNTISVNLDILQHAGVDVRAPPSRDGNPGETVEFTFEMVNTGNGKDRFDCSAGSSLPAVMPYFKDGNNLTTDVLAGGSVNKTVAVILPYDLRTTEGTPGWYISLTAVSNYNRSISATNWTVLWVPHRYDISLGVLPPGASLLPGKPADFTVTVLNLGNGHDNITLGTRASFDAAGWTIALDRDWTNLSGGRQGTTRLRVVPSLAAPVGNYTVEVIANSSGPERIARSESVTITVLHSSRFYLPQENFTAEAPVPLGGSLHIPFNFTNAGNADDVAVMQLLNLPQNWNATLGPSSNIPVRRGATEQAMLNIQPSADPVFSRAGSYPVKVRLSGSDGSFVAHLTFDITVPAAYSWTFEEVWPPLAEVNLFTGNRQSFLFVAENRGNAADELWLVPGGHNASWVRLDTQLLPLGFEEWKSISMEIVVPPGTATGTYAFTLNASSRHQPGQFIERAVELRVRFFNPSDPRPGLELSPGMPKVELRPGGTVELNFTVQCLRDDTSNISLDCIFSERLGITVEQLTPNGQLRHGQNMTFVLRISAPSTDRDTSGYLTVRAVGDNGSAQWAQVPVSIKAAARPGAVISIEGLGLALAVFLALGGLALGWNEVVLLALLTLFLPLYSKIRREEVLDQYTRGKLHGYIIANPGEHYNSLKAQLRMKNGTLAYHLRVLEREGFIKSARDGPYKRFYPQEMAVPKRRSEFSSIQEIVLENIRASPGVTQNDLARRMGVSSQVVNYHVRGLVTAGRVRLERLGRSTRCYLK